MLTEIEIDDIINYLVEYYYAEYCSEYGEPGYTNDNGDAGMIFANWNNVPEELQDALEEFGYDLEWSDEWIVDHKTSKAYRTQPNCYSWESQIHITGDGEILTPDDDVEDWIEEFKIDDHRQIIRALPSHIDISDSDYIKINVESYQNGLFEHMTDDPQEIAEHLFSEDKYCSIVFQIAEQSQFYVGFDVYVLPWEE